MDPARRLRPHPPWRARARGLAGHPAELSQRARPWTSNDIADVIDSVSSTPREAKNGLTELDDPASALDEGEGEGAASGMVPCQTVIPKFDPLEYAEQFETRERMPTLTDEPALEEARLQSFPTNSPPPRRPMSTVPGPLVANMRDSNVEIDLGEEDFDALGPDEQIAILRDRLAPVTRVPSLARPLSEIGAPLEDPKTAYVLGFVDGVLPLDTIIDVTGLPELDTLRVLDRMVGQSIVIFRSRG